MLVYTKLKKSQKKTHEKRKKKSIFIAVVLWVVGFTQCIAQNERNHNFYYADNIAIMSAAALVGRLQMRVSTTSVGGRASQPDQRYNNHAAAFVVAMAKLGSFAS